MVNSKNFKRRLVLYIQKSFLDEKKLRFTEGCHVGEDVEFLLKALALSARTSFVKDLLYTWVHHPSQQTAGGGPRAIDFTSEKSEAIYKLRTAHYIAKRGTKYERDYMVYFYIPETLVHRFSRLAREGNKILYKKMLRILHHRRVRGMLLSTARFVFVAPELLFKSLILLYFPNFYYWMRSRK